MVVYTLEQRWAKWPCNRLTEDVDFGKKNYLCRWSSFWSWRICKQAKLSLNGGPYSRNNCHIRTLNFVMSRNEFCVAKKKMCKKVKDLVWLQQVSNSFYETYLNQLQIPFSSLLFSSNLKAPCKQMKKKGNITKPHWIHKQD